MSKPLNQADLLPISPPTAVVSVSPVVLPAPGRPVALELRVSAPVSGTDLPIILLSHSHGRSNHLSSLNGYAPLANFWAAHGFVVIQPTHLSSRTLQLDGPGAPLFWRARVEDMRRILDQLDQLEAAVPHLRGRLDQGRVAVVGHSMGGHTASMLLGMRLLDPQDGAEVNLTDDRIKAGVLLATPGAGGDSLTPTATTQYPFFAQPSFAAMRTPTLVVLGDQDHSPHLTRRGSAWFADPYHLSPGPKCLLTLFGAGHGLGGVSGYDVAETTDESPERVGVVQRLMWAYLRSTLYPGDTSWAVAQAALAAAPAPLGQVACK